VKQLFLAYRVLATVVGCSIIILIVIGIPLKYAYKVFPDFWVGFLENGSPGQRFGADINLYLGTAHGFIYMAFLVVALLLGITTRWPIGFLIVTLLCGTIPFLSFWAEARAIRRVRAEHPELAAAPPV
jgi:integral membrane protein